MLKINIFKKILCSLFWMIQSIYCLAIGSRTEIPFTVETRRFSTHIHAQTGSGPTLSNRCWGQFLGLKLRILTVNIHFHLMTRL
jgi:hypothetical protein